MCMPWDRYYDTNKEVDMGAWDEKWNLFQYIGAINNVLYYLPFRLWFVLLIHGQRFVPSINTITIIVVVTSCLCIRAHKFSF